MAPPYPKLRPYQAPWEPDGRVVVSAAVRNCGPLRIWRAAPFGRMMMAHKYTLYCLDARGQISMAETIDARDDHDAIRQAKLLKQDALRCEVWDGRRFVADLDARDLVA